MEDIWVRYYLNEFQPLYFKADTNPTGYGLIIKQNNSWNAFYERNPELTCASELTLNTSYACQDRKLRPVEIVILKLKGILS